MVAVHFSGLYVRVTKKNIYKDYSRDNLYITNIINEINHDKMTLDYYSKENIEIFSLYLYLENMTVNQEKYAAYDLVDFTDIHCNKKEIFLSKNCNLLVCYKTKIKLNYVNKHIIHFFLNRLI